MLRPFQVDSKGTELISVVRKLLKKNLSRCRNHILEREKSSIRRTESAKV